MTDEDVTIVQRTPPMAARPLVIPAKAEPREQVEVELVGGPLHGTAIRMWVDAKSIDLPYSPGGEAAPAPVEVEAHVDKDGHTIVETKQHAAAVDAVLCRYKRASAGANTAVFDDFII